MQKKVLALHDLSGFGRSSLVPIISVLSAFGHQCVPLPTAVFFAVPNKDGGRHAERAHIYKVGEIMDKVHGDKWQKAKISVADIREAAGLTQQQLADATGIPVQTLQQIEIGKITAYEAGENYREKIAEALNFYDYQSIF